ncbi:hypothetical protein GA0061082_10314 [Snodgrassella sp. R-53583]|nr:hypothetical protein GA0061082_10314 [Snodgrassella sp. R-53583]
MEYSAQYNCLYLFHNYLFLNNENGKVTTFFRNYNGFEKILALAIVLINSNIN